MEIKRHKKSLKNIKRNNRYLMQTKDRQESAKKTRRKEKTILNLDLAKEEKKESNQNKEKIHLAIPQTEMETKSKQFFSVTK